YYFCLPISFALKNKLSPDGVKSMSIQTAPRCAWLVLVFALLLLSGATSHAQVTGATLSGKITDSSGAVVVGARIVIEKMDTGISRQAMQKDEGLDRRPNLSPG